MTPEELEQDDTADTIFNRAVASVATQETQSPVDHATYALLTAVSDMEAAAKGPTTPAEREALTASCDQISLRLSRLFNTLTRNGAK
jgi:hypothetical protein